MIIVMRPDATEADKKHIYETIVEHGLKYDVSVGEERTVIGVIGDEKKFEAVPVSIFKGVEETYRISKPYKQVSREFRQADTVVEVGKNVKIGGGHAVVMAGPCSVESEAQIVETARVVKKHGAKMLRGGAYKPRTSPYAFQGLGPEGLKFLKTASEESGLPFVTEVMDTRDVEHVAEIADMIQIGARNMQNFNLLKEVGKCDKPVLLKRGLSATIQELLLSAEYIFSEGNKQVVLCERGIRTFETNTRNTPDLVAIPIVHEYSHLPVIFDPSHSIGKSKYVPEMSRAAMAAGADGIMVEVHLKPEEALCDGPQALVEEKFKHLMNEIKQITAFMNKEI